MAIKYGMGAINAPIVWAMKSPTPAAATKPTITPKAMEDRARSFSRLIAFTAFLVFSSKFFKGSLQINAFKLYAKGVFLTSHDKHRPNLWLAQHLSLWGELFYHAFAASSVH